MVGGLEDRDGATLELDGGEVHLARHPAELLEQVERDAEVRLDRVDDVVLRDLRQLGEGLLERVERQAERAEDGVVEDIAEDAECGLELDQTLGNAEHRQQVVVDERVVRVAVAVGVVELGEHHVDQAHRLRIGP